MDRTGFEIYLLEIRQALKEDIKRLKLAESTSLSEYRILLKSLTLVKAGLRNHRLSKLGITAS